MTTTIQAIGHIVDKKAHYFSGFFILLKKNVKKTCILVFYVVYLHYVKKYI